MTRITDRARFLSVVLGNIVICSTVAVLIAISFSGSAAARADGRLLPYYSGLSETKVSLMINVYWGTEYIEPMLDILDAHGAKTTFFVGGSWAATNAQTLKAIRDRGHEIANHGYWHKDHAKLDAAGNRREITSTHEAVADILGTEMHLFAPPSGAFCNATIETATELGYRTVMWTRDTVDWRDHDPELIYARAVKNLKGGDLILMHPTESTVQALDRIITAVYSHGLGIAPVSEVLDGGVS